MSITIIRNGLTGETLSTALLNLTCRGCGTQIECQLGEMRPESPADKDSVYELKCPLCERLITNEMLTQN